MIKSFTAGCSRTVNLGNFESLRIEASVVIEVPEECESFDELRDYAQRELRKLLEETYKYQYGDRKKIA